MQIEGFTVFGLKQDSRVPQLITSKEQDSRALLDVLFETHPVDDTCDQRIHVTSESLKLVYDAHTINTVVDVFRAPREVQLAK
jgi:vacuolar protein sorting-associated protein 13A/C